LFEGYGLELEYMIVDEKTLAVLPATDKVLHAVAGEYADEVELGDLAWSNELVLHVIELKTLGPVPSLRGLARSFDEHLDRIRGILAPLHARLMPGAAHPWMDPERETVLWPHAYNPVYETLDRIFNCQGHGWSNIQCTHINLPFAGDEEFGRLHAAVRCVLPIIPAIAASSPIFDGRVTGIRDSRLDVYRANSSRIPSVTGLVIPEPVFSRSEYEREILEPMYAEIAEHDPEGILRYEWLNARGAIARFDRSAIEIRIVDSQECPACDVAVAFAVSAVARALVEERWQDFRAQRQWPTGRLNDILVATTRDAEDAAIADRDYLRAFGYPGESCTAGDLWRYLADGALAATEADGVDWERPFDVILRRGTLATRIVTALDGDVSMDRIKRVYTRLCDCLDNGEMFDEA
jgi:gamma-glutamyl:cysteine ligase YbdK (ATP-grasp superfamily)